MHTDGVNVFQIVVNPLFLGAPGHRNWFEVVDHSLRWCFRCCFSSGFGQSWTRASVCPEIMMKEVGLNRSASLYPVGERGPAPHTSWKSREPSRAPVQGMGSAAGAAEHGTPQMSQVMIHNQERKAAQGIFSARNQFISKYVHIAQLSPAFLQDQPTDVPDCSTSMAQRGERGQWLEGGSRGIA